jgi:hypothetical protein
MDELLKILIPAMIVIFYIYNAISGKSEGDDKKPSSSGKTHGQNPQKLEQQRQTVEENKRKAREQWNSRQGLSSGPPQPPAQNVVRESLLTSVLSNISYPPMDNSKTSKSSYEAHLQSQMAKLEMAHQEIARLRRQIAASAQSGSKKSASNVFKSNTSVRKTFTNPRVARAAFIYSEVLGQPVGMRN